MRRRTFLAGLAVTAPLAACGSAGAEEKAFSAAEAEATFPPVGDHVEAGGERLHYWESGEGPAVVLIHGASGNLRDWTFRLAPRLAERYRVIAFDRPGFGYSTRRRRDVSDPVAQAEILAAGARRLGVERPLLVGHSYGGAVALAWAMQERPAGVVTVSAVAMPYASVLGRISRSIGLNELITEAFYGYVKSRYGEGVVRDFVARVFRPQPIPEGYIAHIGAPLSLREVTLEANAEDLSDLNAALERMAPRYAGLSVPVEVLHGLADQTVRPDHARRLAEALPDGRLTLFDGIGHMAHHARPDAVVHAMARLTGA